ncbi:MAG: permease prefix domain 1-containing protein, partial [Kofleriaceae bacterium]
MIKAAIATYREDLTRAGAIDDATIEELVDHLEASIEANVAAGATDFEAIRDARAGLGEPAIIARECATVRSGFGPRPATWRAWSAAALCLLWCAVVANAGWFHEGAGYGIMILGSVTAMALALRIPQATAFATGYAGAALACSVIRWCLFPPWNAQFSTDSELREHYLVSIAVPAFEAAAFAILAWRSRPNRWTLAMSALGVVAYIQLAAQVGRLPTAN